jgi:hypothetical protein
LSGGLPSLFEDSAGSGGYQCPPQTNLLCPNLRLRAFRALIPSQSRFVPGRHHAVHGHVRRSGRSAQTDAKIVRNSATVGSASFFNLDEDTHSCYYASSSTSYRELTHTCASRGRHQQCFHVCFLAAVYYDHKTDLEREFDLIRGTVPDYGRGCSCRCAAICSTCRHYRLCCDSAVPARTWKQRTRGFHRPRAMATNARPIKAQ